MLTLPADATGPGLHRARTQDSRTRDVTVRVEAGDTLRRSRSGSPATEATWPRAFDANQGRVEPGGEHFTDPNLIKPGWTLDIPVARTAEAPPAPAAPNRAATPRRRPRPSPPVLRHPTPATPAPPAPTTPAPTPRPETPATRTDTIAGVDDTAVADAQPFLARHGRRVRRGRRAVGRRVAIGARHVSAAPISTPTARPGDQAAARPRSSRRSARSSPLAPLASMMSPGSTTRVRSLVQSSADLPSAGCPTSSRYE